jgi:hypothetical protein
MHPIISYITQHSYFIIPTNYSIAYSLRRRYIHHVDAQVELGAVDEVRVVEVAAHHRRNLGPDL